MLSLNSGSQYLQKKNQHPTFSSNQKHILQPQSDTHISGRSQPTTLRGCLDAYLTSYLRQLRTWPQSFKSHLLICMDHIQQVFLRVLVSGIAHCWQNSFKCLAETHVTSFLRSRIVSVHPSLEKAKKKAGNRKGVKRLQKSQNIKKSDEYYTVCQAFET